MVIEDAENKILEYLKRERYTNTFKLARELRINRHKILNILENLEKKQAVEFKTGNVKFLKFPTKEQKLVEKPLKAENQIKVKKTPFKLKKETKYKVKKTRPKRKPKILQTLQAENKKLRGELAGLESSIKRRPHTKNKKLREQTEEIETLKKTIKELQQKANAPLKIIKRTITKKVPIKVKEKKSKALETLKAENKKLRDVLGELELSMKRQPNVGNKVREQAKHTKKLEETIKELRKKASAPKIIRKTTIKKVPVRVKEEIPKKEKIKLKKFKLPKINLDWTKNIQQLERPEFIDRKIRAEKINFTRLNENIKQLHVPEMLR